MDCDTYRCAAVPQYLYYVCMLLRQGLTLVALLNVVLSADLNISFATFFFACVNIIMKVLISFVDIMYT